MTPLVGLESRVSVAEKSTRALLVEVVRLQAAVDGALKSADDEREARRDAEDLTHEDLTLEDLTHSQRQSEPLHQRDVRRDAENRMRATADTLTQLFVSLSVRLSRPWTQ